MIVYNLFIGIKYSSDAGGTYTPICCSPHIEQVRRIMPFDTWAVICNDITDITPSVGAARIYAVMRPDRREMPIALIRGFSEETIRRHANLSDAFDLVEIPVMPA